MCVGVCVHPFSLSVGALHCVSFPFSSPQRFSSDAGRRFLFFVVELLQLQNDFNSTLTQNVWWLRNAVPLDFPFPLGYTAGEQLEKKSPKDTVWHLSEVFQPITAENWLLQRAVERKLKASCRLKWVLQQQWNGDGVKQGKQMTEKSDRRWKY